MAAAKAWGLTPGQWWALDPVEQAVILAYEMNVRDVCPGCGTPTAVGTSGDWMYDIEDSPTCHACVAIAQHDKAHEKRKPRPGVFRTILPIRRKKE